MNEMGFLDIVVGLRCATYRWRYRCRYRCRDSKNDRCLLALGRQAAFFPQT